MLDRYAGNAQDNIGQHLRDNQTFNPFVMIGTGWGAILGGAFVEDEDFVFQMLEGLTPEERTQVVTGPGGQEFMANFSQNLGSNEAAMVSALTEVDPRTGQCVPNPAHLAAVRIEMAMHGSGTWWDLSSLGTDEDKILSELDGLTPEQVQEMRDYHERTFTTGAGGLATALRDELADFGTAGADWEVVAAELDGDKVAADVARIRFAAEEIPQWMSAGLDYWAMVDPQAAAGARILLNTTNEDLLESTLKAGNEGRGGRNAAHLQAVMAEFEAQFGGQGGVYGGNEAQGLTAFQNFLSQETSGIERVFFEDLSDDGQAGAEIELMYAMSGLGTDEARVERVLTDLYSRPPGERAAFNRRFQQMSREMFGVDRDLHEWVADDFGGRDQFQMELLLMGEPRTPAEIREVARMRYEFERSNPISGAILDFMSFAGISSDAEILDRNTGRIEALFEGDHLANPNDPNVRARLDELSAWQVMDVERYRETVDAAADAISTAVQVVGAVVLLLIPGTQAGAAAVIAQMVLAAAATAVKIAVKGANAYAWGEEGLQDLAQIALAGLTAGMGQMGSGAGNVVEEAVEQAAKNGLREFLRDGAQEVLSGAVEGLLSSAIQSEEAWDQGGFAFASHLFQGMVMGGVSSAASFGAGRAFGATNMGQRLSQIEDALEGGVSLDGGDFMEHLALSWAQSMTVATATTLVDPAQWQALADGHGDGAALFKSIVVDTLVDSIGEVGATRSSHVQGMRRRSQVEDAESNIAQLRAAIESGDFNATQRHRLENAVRAQERTLAAQHAEITRLGGDESGYHRQMAEVRATEIEHAAAQLNHVYNDPDHTPAQLNEARQGLQSARDELGRHNDHLRQLHPELDVDDASNDRPLHTEAERIRDDEAAAETVTDDDAVQVAPTVVVDDAPTPTLVPHPDDVDTDTSDRDTEEPAVVVSPIVNVGEPEPDGAERPSADGESDTLDLDNDPTIEFEAPTVEVAPVDVNADFETLRPRETARAQERLDHMPEAERARVDDAMGAAQSDLERRMILKAVAAGRDPDDIEWLGDHLRGQSDEWIRRHTSLAGNGDGERGIVQQGTHSCGPTSMRALQAEFDPVFAARMREMTPDIDVHDGDSPEAHVQRALLTRPEPDGHQGVYRQIGDPAQADGAGQGRWVTDLLNDPHVQAATGLEYRDYQAMDRDDAVDSLVAALERGHPTLVVVGDASHPSAHYMMASEVREHNGEVQVRLHQPGRGEGVWRSVDDLRAGNSDLDGWSEIRGLHVPVELPASVPASDFAGPTTDTPTIAASDGNTQPMSAVVTPDSTADNHDTVEMPAVTDASLVASAHDTVEMPAVSDTQPMSVVADGRGTTPGEVPTGEAHEGSVEHRLEQHLSAAAAEYNRAMDFVDGASEHNAASTALAVERIRGASDPQITELALGVLDMGDPVLISRMSDDLMWRERQLAAGRDPDAVNAQFRQRLQSAVATGGGTDSNRGAVSSLHATSDVDHALAEPAPPPRSYDSRSYDPEQTIMLQGGHHRFAALMHIVESGDLGNVDLDAVVGRNGESVRELHQMWREGRITSGNNRDHFRVSKAEGIVESMREHGYITDSADAPDAVTAMGSGRIDDQSGVNLINGNGIRLIGNEDSEGTELRGFHDFVNGGGAGRDLDGEDRPGGTHPTRPGAATTADPAASSEGQAPPRVNERFANAEQLHADGRLGQPLADNEAYWRGLGYTITRHDPPHLVRRGDNDDQAPLSVINGVVVPRRRSDKAIEGDRIRRSEGGVDNLARAMGMEAPPDHETHHLLPVNLWRDHPLLQHVLDQPAAPWRCCRCRRHQGCQNQRRNRRPHGRCPGRARPLPRGQWRGSAPQR